MTKRKGAIRGAALLSALMLCGCAGMAQLEETRRSEAEGNIAPRNPRADIVALMRTYLNDPTNVREASVSEPELREVGPGRRRYVSCLRYNARMSDGRYAGRKVSLVTFWQGRLDRITDNPGDRCRDADYRPFPELMRMTR